MRCAPGSPGSPWSSSGSRWMPGWPPSSSSTPGPVRSPRPTTGGSSCPIPRRCCAGSAVHRIHFGVGTGELLAAMAEAGADVVGVDWRTPLAQAARRIGPGPAVQGNLDPCALFAPWEALEAEVRRVVAEGRRAVAAGARGHVFNLGHGVLPETDPDTLRRVVDLVHAI